MLALLPLVPVVLCAFTGDGPADGAPAAAPPAAGEDIELVSAEPAPRPLPFPAPPTEDERRWALTPYLWMTAMEGDATVKGRTANVDLSFGDILDHLDLGLMGHFEGQTAENSVFMDLTWAALEAEEDLAPGVEAELDLGLTIFELGGGLVLGDPPAAEVAPEAQRRVEVLGGLRYWRVTGDLDVTGVFSGDDTEEWVDPFVGLRAAFPLNDELQLSLRGDVGGFNVGSDFSYNAVAALLWQAFDNGNLAAGYRVLDADYDDGSGADRFEFDARLKGPFVGLMFRF